jgi:phosphoribosylformylglycinamidine cyclo-ligase
LATNHHYFAQLQEDVAGDNDYYSLLHADAAGTKTLVAYLAYRESGDLRWFRGLAQDALVMNLDDIACVGALESILLSNTIGRNKSLIPDAAVAEIISSFKDLTTKLATLDIQINMAGGETEDVGDILRTLSVGCTLFARVKKQYAITTQEIAPGDVIVALASDGQASYEEEPNSGIGSNGITAARHALINRSYALCYPEIVNQAADQDLIYQGKQLLNDQIEGLGMSVVEALLSPTRTYAPVVKKVLNKLGKDASTLIHGIIHCSGGGQTKIIRFGKRVRFVKNNLFPPAKVFQAIQNSLSLPWSEMYAVFNMGQRIEFIVPSEVAKEITECAASFNIQGRIVGHVEKSQQEKNQVVIDSQFGAFEY